MLLLAEGALSRSPRYGARAQIWQVPCFSLVLERGAASGSEDMLGFLVQIALHMQPCAPRRDPMADPDGEDQHLGVCGHELTMLARARAQ